MNIVHIWRDFSADFGGVGSYVRVVEGRELPKDAVGLKWGKKVRPPASTTPDILASRGHSSPGKP